MKAAGAWPYTTGVSISLLADQFFFVTLGWTATSTAGAGGASIVLTAAAIARLAVLLFGGVITDRFGARRLAIISDIARAVLMLGAASMLLALSPTLQTLLVVSIIFGVVDALFLPSIGALPAQFSSTEDVPKLQAVRTTAQRASMVFGAPLAGLLVGIQGFSAVLWVNAALFAISAFSFKLINAPHEAAPHQEKPRIHREVWAGFRYVARYPVLLMVVALTAVTELCLAGAFNIGMPILSVSNDWGPEGLGVLLGAFGAGAAVSALYLTRYTIPRAGLAAGISVGAMGIGLMALTLWEDVLTAALIMSLIGLASGICSSVLAGLATTCASREQQGKVMSFLAIASFGGVPFSYALAGYLAEHLGPHSPFVIGGLSALFISCAALLAKGLRLAEIPRGPR